MRNIIGVSPSGKAAAFEAAIRWFESIHPSQKPKKCNRFSMMRQIISFLSFIGFLFFAIQLPIDYLDPRGIELANFSIVLGIVGFFGLLSTILFFINFKFGKLFLNIFLAVYSLIFIFQGIHTYQKEDYLASMASIVMCFFGVLFLILALLTYFGVSEDDNQRTVSNE